MRAVHNILVVLFVGTMVVAPSLAMAALPKHTAADVVVNGEGTVFTIGVELTAGDNGTYHVEISETENVTNNFELIENGSSAKKFLPAGAIYNFTIRLRTKGESLRQTHELPYEVYQNEVLVDNGVVSVTVVFEDAPNPGDFNCNLCSGLIPLSIVSGLFIVVKRKRNRALKG